MSKIHPLSHHKISMRLLPAWEYAITQVKSSWKSLVRRSGESQEDCKEVEQSQSQDVHWTKTNRRLMSKCHKVPFSKEFQCLN